MLCVVFGFERAFEFEALIVAHAIFEGVGGDGIGGAQVGGGVASLAIEVGGEAWEAELVGAFYRLSKVEERLREDPVAASADFEERNRDFHRALIGACPSPWLHRLYALLYQQSERYRRMVVSRRTIPRDVHVEHQGILDATLARNADLACQLTGEHIERSVKALEKLFEAREKYTST